jgi:anti-anti-sigma factor
MDINELTIDQNLLERINPVFNTAKMTLFQLSAAGDQDAVRISDKLGLTLESTNRVSSPEEMMHNIIVLETRFRTMGTLAEETGFTEVDLPCGYTPRAIEFARKGKKFVGLDLPAAIAEAEPAIMSLIDEDKRHLVRFEDCDATNYESLKKVFDSIPGEVCITTEGLLMYFTDSEAGQLCDNIRRILQEHGGCWITADPETGIQFVLTTRAIYGDRFMEVLLKDQKQAQDKSDVPVTARTLVVSSKAAEENIRNAMMFLAKHGLKAERMIVGEHAPEVASLKMAAPEQAEAIRRTMGLYAYWKITPIAGKQLDTAGAKGENFDVKAELDGEKLSLQLSGRLDTLTAPALIAFFEKTAGENKISEADVDCAALDYISSAGLRALLMMHKQCEKGVTVRNTNEVVKEILEQTGFDSILNIAG